MKKIKFIISFLFISITLFASPYELSLKKELSIIGLGAGLATVVTVKNKDGYISEKEIAGLDKNDINFFDRIANNKYSEKCDQISTALLLTTLLSPSLLGFEKEIKDDYKIVGTMYFETLLLTYYTTNIAKTMISRERPYLYNSKSSLNKKLEDNSAKNSFFSGHTSMCFSSAVFLSKVYSDYNPNSKKKNYIWAGTLLSATTVAVLRYESGEHYPSDIIFGAIAGTLYGYYIPELHRKKDKKITVLPSLSHNGCEISFIYTF